MTIENETIIDTVIRERHEATIAERRRIAEKLEGKDFCVCKSECRGASPKDCLGHIYEWLGADCE